MKNPDKKDEEQQPEIPDWLKACYIPFHPTVSFEMLCRSISKKTGLPPEKVKKAISDFEKAAIEVLKQGKKIDLNGLGKLNLVPKEGDSDDPNDKFEVRFELSEEFAQKLKERITKDPSLN